MGNFDGSLEEQKVDRNVDRKDYICEILDRSMEFFGIWIR